METDYATDVLPWLAEGRVGIYMMSDLGATNRIASGV
jgi:hypothetical protein